MGKEKKKDREEKEASKPWSELVSDHGETSDESSVGNPSETSQEEVRKAKKRAKKERKQARKEKEREAALAESEAEALTKELKRMQQESRDSIRKADLANKRVTEAMERTKVIVERAERLRQEASTSTEEAMEVDTAPGGRPDLPKPPQPLVPIAAFPKIPKLTTPKGKGQGKSTKVSSVKPAPANAAVNKAGKSTVTTRPPAQSSEPAETDPRAVEEDVPDFSPPKDAEWRTVAQRARTRRGKPDTRPVRKLQSYRDDRGHVKLPDLVGTEGSDDEEWLEDEGHPIDWYVRLLETVIRASSNSGVAREERLRLSFAWNMFNPGGSCSFSSCEERGQPDRRTFATDGRFARHLIEHHRARRPRFGCLLVKGQKPCGGTDGGTNTFHTPRRGLFVRHLRLATGGTAHKRSAADAIQIVADAVRFREDNPEAMATGKYYMNWEANHEPRRLYIRQTLWPAFMGMNPGYRSQSVSRGQNSARGRASGVRESQKRAHSVEPRAVKSPKKARSEEGSSPERGSGRQAVRGSKRQSRDRSRDKSRTSTSVRSDSGQDQAAVELTTGPTFAAVVGGESSHGRTPAPSARETLVCSDVSATHWSDTVPFGNLSEPGLPDLGFIEKCRGLLEMTGNAVVDDVGRAFRLEANAFMFRLFGRVHDCMATMQDRVAAETAQKMKERADEQFQGLEEQLANQSSRSRYDIRQLQDRIAEYEAMDLEFFRVYGARLSDWYREPARTRIPLEPRRASPSQQVAAFLQEGRQRMEAELNVKRGVLDSPRTANLTAEMRKLGSAQASPNPATPGRGLELLRPVGGGTEASVQEMDCTVSTAMPGVTPLRVPTPTRKTGGSRSTSASPAKAVTPKITPPKKVALSDSSSEDETPKRLTDENIPAVLKAMEHQPKPSTPVLSDSGSDSDEDSEISQIGESDEKLLDVDEQAVQDITVPAQLPNVIFQDEDSRQSVESDPAPNDEQEEVVVVDDGP